MVEDFERCYRAVQSRDSRFDGWFVTAVSSTRIYCRPSCPARTPKPANVRFFPTAAAAQSAGFRSCKRCRPDAAPGSPAWDARGDVVARAMRLVADGVVDREGVPGLARRLGYSPRHLHRLLVGELGAGPLALARAQRAHTARVLIETTDLPLTDVAFAAGFSSIRQFNDTVRAVFAGAPRDLRRGAQGPRTRPAPPEAGFLRLRLPYRRPLAAAPLFRFLATRAVPGVEVGDDHHYRRAVALPHGAGVVELADAGRHIDCTLRLDDLRDLGPAVAGCRRLLDLDADPEAVDACLGGDPLLGPAVTARPGLRVPGALDPAEIAVRAVLGQQVSVAAARTAAARLVAEHGAALATPHGAITRLFPRAAEIAGLDGARLPLPAARAAAVVAVAEAVASGRLDVGAGAERDAAVATLESLPGVGPWTAAYIAMRALGDPDAFCASDHHVRRVLHHAEAVSGERAVAARGRAWRPWRAYAVMHIWNLPNAKEPRGAHSR